MSEFVTHLTEVFREFGAITSRKMFGGYGIYHDGLMFGLVADDELYLKVDADSEPHFSNLGLERFNYEKDGKIIRMSYCRAPEAIFDEPDVAVEWARRAYDAALRAKQK